MWIFGYGSLLWYTNFPVVRKLCGRITGFRRRFWQASPDHRGTPEKPGRTVTLLPDSEVFMRVLLVSSDNEQSVREYLTWREKAGYGLRETLFYPVEAGVDPFVVEVYASEMDHHFVGEEEQEVIASRIVHSIGPSGTNIEYLLKIAHALRGMGVEDPHIYDLEKRVLKLCREKGIVDDCFKQLNIDLWNN